MTEKRFDYTNYDDGTESIYDREEDEYYFNTDLDKIGEILNGLHDENKALKERRHEDINDLSVIAMKYKALEEENNNLKELRQKDTQDIMITLNKFLTIDSENILLKKDNERLIEFIKSKGYNLKDYLEFCGDYNND